jgi:uncharacterized protein (TIGR00725 family)
VLQVGVAAYSGEPTSELEAACRRFIEGLARGCGGRVVMVVGGYWGLMRCVVDEALSRGVRVVILPPLEREDYGYPEQAIVVRSGCSFRCRSIILVRSSDVLVALGGAVGTLIEVLAAYAEGKPVYVLAGTGLDTDRYRSTISPYVDSRRLARVEYMEDAGQLAERVCSMAG